MIGGIRFALARARAATAPLVTLAVVAALCALLVVVTAGVIATVEAREVRAALATATGERGAVELTLESDAARGAAIDAVEGLLREHGASGALVVGGEIAVVVLSPDLETITASEAAALVDVLGGVRDAVEDSTDVSVQVSGGLRDTLEGITAGVDARRGPTAVAIALQGLLTAVVVGAVALEAVRMRSTETMLLRARGARRRDLVSLASIETLVVAAAGAVAGAGVGVAAVLAFGGVPAGLILAAGAALAIAVVAAIVVAVVTARGVDRGSARARAAADIGLVIVLAVVTALAVWQFAQSGTPIVERGDGTAVLDPLVAIAPALALALVALVAVALATPIARAVSAALAPTRGMTPVTPLRLAARRPARHALSITVVAFAIGAVTIAGTYQGSLTALGDAPEALRVGADVRVTTIPDDVAAADVATAGDPDAAMLARPLNARGADQRLPILAAQASELGAVMLDAGGAIDPAALGDALMLSSSGAPLSGTDIALTLLTPSPPPVVFDGEEYQPGPPEVEARVTAVSSTGQVARFVFSNTDTMTVENNGDTFVTSTTREQTDVSFDLPAGEGWALAGVDVGLRYLNGGANVIEFTEFTSGGAAVDVSGFRSAGGSGGVEASASALTFTLEVDGEYTRAVAADIPAVVPAVITAALADTMSLGVGDDLALSIVSPDVDIDFQIAEVIPVLPGSASGQGMLVDLATVSLASPLDIVANQVWMSTDDPGAVTAAVEEAFPETVTIVADPRSADNAAGTALAFLLAAVGAVGLALVVLVLRRTRSRADSRELALLAVLGLGRGRAVRLRAREDLFAVVMGVVGGLAAGVATAWLVVPPLVRAAYVTVPEAYPVPLQASPVLLGAALVVVAGVFCVVVSTVRAPAALAPLMREDE
ncbi:FtsX-like permease family protein [Microbacterium sp. 2FI]|uniref:FtsX-like permease family protein n=1 Tax=Microbacterium sp. 2FI TaxID=2502193 RepID=UPI0014850618|nr:FtsX-like permease family protein [Microbacterium sp. 2FI]